MSSKTDVVLATGILAMLLVIYVFLMLVNPFQMQQEQVTVLVSSLVLFLLVYLTVREIAPAR